MATTSLGIGRIEGWGGSYGSSNIIENPTYSNNRQTGLTYDAAGNLTNDGSQNYNYDATGQQTTASGAGLSQSYDGDRLRAKKIENGVATYYLRSSVLGGQVVAEINSGGSWTRGFVYLGGQMVALQGGTGGAVSWVHQDPVTKSQRVTNGSGTIISTVDLDPWGGETGRSLTSAFQPHRYTTYERDANGGDEAMMRRYQSTASQFSQPDPYDGSYSLTNPQSFNRYAYVQNDPVNFVDPAGLDPIDIGNVGDVTVHAGPDPIPTDALRSLSSGRSEIDRILEMPIGIEGGGPQKPIPQPAPTPTPAPAAPKPPGLPPCIKNYLPKFFDRSMLDAMTWSQGIPWYVPMDAAAFTLDDHIYFGTGSFDSSDGIQLDEIILIGHETTHARQYRQNGSLRMKGKYLVNSAIMGAAGSYVGVPFDIASYYGNKFEQEAFKMEKKIKDDLAKNGNPCP